MKNGLYINNINLIDLKNHFELLSKDFINQISKRVDLNKYLEKIYNNAKSYEYWENDILIGLAAVYENRGIEHPAYLTNISIIENQCGRGMASKLLDFVIVNLKKNGFKQFMLEVQKDNNIALHMYKKRGFVIMSQQQEVATCLMLLDM